jgi:hypothetical protein
MFQKLIIVVAWASIVALTLINAFGQKPRTPRYVTAETTERDGRRDHCTI